jgi:DNA-3-methyladenine glycosylase II
MAQREQHLQRGLTELIALDPDMARAHAEAGPPSLDLREPGYTTLLRAIVAQQVSNQAAAAIWKRITTRVAPLTPASFLALDDEEIRALGLSRQKVRYARGLAADIVERRLDLEAVGRMDDEAALTELIKVKGIGRWSAEVYLLFALGRADVWPAADLALAVATQRLKGLAERPTPVELRDIGEIWRPWRSLAARLLWHHYKATP